MAEDTMTLRAVRRKGEAPPEDLVRRAVQLVLRELLDAAGSAQIGAERDERTPDRLTQRSG